jgi:septal ring-binding cell division protein DamX
MRFEVKSGGIVAIVFALTLLSGAVFVLGLLAGYDVGRQAQIDTAQLATSYPLQSPPSPSATSNQPSAEQTSPPMQSESASGSPARTASAPVTAASAGNLSSGGAASANQPPKPPQPAQKQARPRLASAAPPSSTRSSAGDDSATDEDSGVTESENPEAVEAPSEASTNSGPEEGGKVASAAAPVHRKPYNIQIQAVMDISGADQMMERLQRLGYTSHLVPTEIAGQRWYKVEVGPYATPQEASNAEAQLRERYDETYGRVAHDNSSPPSSAGDDSEE